MIVESSVAVAATRDRVFDALVDVPRAVTCLPRVRVEEAGEGAVTGDVRLVVGRSTITYRGTVTITSRDRRTGALAIRLEAREARGSGRIAGTIDVCLSGANGTTTVLARGELDVSGRASAADEQVLQGAAATLLERFGTALSAMLSSQAAAASRGPRTAGAGPARQAAATAPAPERARQTPGDSAPAQPVAPAAPERAERRVRGVVRLMTAQPIRADQVGRLARSGSQLASQARRRPWLVPASLLGGIAVALIVLRDRR